MGFRTDISRAALCAGFAVIGLSCEQPAAEDGAGGAVQATAAALVEIDSCAELQAIASDLTGAYSLTADVDCSGFDAGDGDGFMPLGERAETPFTGTFDGNGHVITGLRIDRVRYDVGLFGATEGSVIERVGLLDANVNGAASVGSLIGFATDSTVRQVFATGTVRGAVDTGGLLGELNPGSSLLDSYASVALEFAWGEENNHGLLVGWVAGTIERSYAAGTAPANLGWVHDDGGIVRSFYDCEVAGDCSAAGASSTATMADLDTYFAADWDFDDTWGVLATGGYPCLRWQDGCGCAALDSDGDGVGDCQDLCVTDATKSAPGTCGCGNPDVDSDGDGPLDCNDPCPFDATKVQPGLCGCNEPDVDGDGDGILNCNDPDWAHAVRDCSELQAIREDLAGKYRLVLDIDCTGFDVGDGQGFQPLGERDGDRFSGQFDGNGHVVRGLRIARPDRIDVGLFGATAGALIERVGVVDVDIEGNHSVGALVGNAADTTIRESYSTGVVRGWADTGGLVGEVNPSGTIEDSYAAVLVEADHDHGLLVGWVDGAVERSYASGSAPATLGAVYGGSFDQCFFDCDVAGGCSSEGGTSTVAMSTRETYTNAGWDFGAKWGFRGPTGYPCLRWQEGCGCVAGRDSDGDGVVDCADPDLLGYWAFDEPSGNVALDLTANPTNGTITNATRTPNGRSGGALYFNGTNSRVAIPNGEWNVGTPVTYSVWYKADGSPTGYVFEHQHTSVVRGSFAFAPNAFSGASYDSIRFSGYDSTGAGVGLPRRGPSSPGIWTMATAVVSSSAIRLYKNGEPLDPSPITGGLPVVAGPLYIGARGEVPDNFFKGWIDDFSVYGRAMTDSEVAALYQSYGPAPATPWAETGLVGQWKLDEGSGSVASDTSGYGNNGSLLGAATWAPNGLSGSCLRFDGASSLVRIPDGVWNQTGNVTYIAWHKNDPSPAGNYLLEHELGSNIRGVFAVRSSHPGFGAYDSTQTARPASITWQYPSPPPGEWRMVAIAFTPTEARVYSNGTLVGTSPLVGGVPYYPGRLFLGGRGSQGDGFYRGWIDEVSIYARTLSDAEILDLYTTQPTSEGCDEDSDCEPGLTCGYGIGPRFGRPATEGACWDPAACSYPQPGTCGELGDPCGRSCCTPDCNQAGTPDGCGGTCPACVPGADSDRDGLLDCTERTDGTRWTNSLVFNGVTAFQGPACHATPTCAAVDTVAEIATCFSADETRGLRSGWDFATADDDICDPDFQFEPEWSTCREDFAVWYETLLKLESSGRHCFEVEGLTSSQCGVLFLNNEAIGQVSGSGPKCLDLPAGIHALHWFYETTNDSENQLSVNHCFGGAADCDPQQELSPRDLRQPGNAPLALCDGECSELCPCGIGEGCNPTDPNGFCQPGLECRQGLGTRFGLASEPAVCWDPGCDNPRSEAFECGAVTDRCGLCPTCPVTASCAGKSCGTDGCFGRCGTTCNAGQGGCETDADCANGLVCLHAAGVRFGLAPGLNVCAPGDCRSLSRSRNPCLNPSNQGDMTVCGVCPDLIADCEGRECGPNGAGGTCGQAPPPGTSCQGGRLVPVLERIVPSPLPDRPVPTVSTAEVGTLPGDVSVSHAGDATYRIPLSLPPGRGGLTPELALSYAGNRGNGLLGIGWALDGMQAVTRCERTFSQDERADSVHFDERDAFCLNGQRLVEIGTREVQGESATEYALEANDFSGVLAFQSSSTDTFEGPARFELTTRDGRVLVFGDTERSRILGPYGGTPKPAAQTWALSRITDRHGNYAQVDYEQPRRDPGATNDPYAALADTFTRREYYPTSILYSMHPTDPVPQVVVLFGYDDARPDPANAWRGGTNIQVNRRLSRIVVVADRQNRQYLMSYSHGGSNDPQQSRLQSVQECADQSLVAIPTTCLPPTTFTYERAGRLRPPIAAGNASQVSIQTVLDFDGDGRDDLLVSEGGADKLMLSRVSADGTAVAFQTFHTVPGAPHYSSSSSSPAPVAPGADTDLHVLDWDNDGHDDVLDFESAYVYRSVSDQSGARFERESLNELEPTEEREGSKQRQYFLLDVDGDGRKDLADCKDGNWRYALRGNFGFGSWSDPIQARLSNNDAVPSCPALSDTAGAPRQGYNQVLDIDSDGSDELLFVVDDRVGTALFPEAATNTSADAVFSEVITFRTLTFGPYYRPGLALGGNQVVFHNIPIYTVPRRDRPWLVLKLQLPIDEEAEPNARVIDTGVPSNTKIIDMNGDALPDLYRIEACASKPDRELCKTYGPPHADSWINTGRVDSTAGLFVENASVPLPDYGWTHDRLTVDGAARLAKTLDHDGDARQDVLFPTPNQGWQVLRSTGTGFEIQPLAFSMPSDEQQGSPSLDARQAIWSAASPTVLDLNGDGQADFLRRRITSFSATGFPAGHEWQVSLRAAPSLPRLLRAVNGLGERIDIDYALLTDPESEVYSADTAFPCEYPQRCGALRRSVVQEVRRGRTGTAGELLMKVRQRYAYADGRTDLWGRGFIGFGARATHIDPSTQPANYARSVFAEYDNRVRDNRTNAYFKAQIPERTIDSRSDGDLTASTMVTRQMVALHPFHAPGTMHAFEVRRDELLREAHGAGPTTILQHWVTVVPEEQIDKYGNPKIVARGIVADESEQMQVFGLRTDVPEGIRVLSTSYMHESIGTAFDQPGKRHLPEKQVELFLQTGQGTPWGETVTNARETGFEYYENGSTKKIIVEPRPDDPLGDQASLHRETTFERDDFGNVLREITGRTASDSLRRIREYVYADSGFARGQFPIEIVNEEGHHSTVQYDARYGTLARITDANGAAQDWYYDDFGRLVASVDVDETVTTIAYSTGGPSAAMRVRTRVDGGRDETVDYDWFGRQVRSVTEGFQGRDLVSDSTYDDLDRLIARTRPHKQGIGGIDDALARTSITYDARDRVLSEQWSDKPPGGTAATRTLEHCYSGLTACTRNPRGFTSCSRRDRLGHEVRTWDPPVTPNPEQATPQSLPSCPAVLNALPNRTDHTDYAYGEWLESIRDSNSNRTKISYDRYGRRLRLADPDTGVSRYAWDHFGQLVRTEDADGRVSELEYDDLGRQVVRRDVDLLGAGMDGTTRWYFDGEDPDGPGTTPGAFIGALTTTETPEGNRMRYEYDGIGQVTRAERALEGDNQAPLVMRFEDYAFGRAQLLHYPSAGELGSFSVRKTYDDFGHLESIRRVGQTGDPLWRVSQTAEYDQLRQEHFSNGISTSYSHDSVGRVSAITDAPVTGAALRFLGLVYDANGNVISRSSGSQTEDLRYDHLDRMRFSTIAGQVGETQYDRLGNIMQHQHVGTYAYGATNAPDPSGLFINGSKAHAVSHAGDVGYIYDASGNMIERSVDNGGASSHFSWTRFGKIAQMWSNATTPDAGQNVISLRYDADGKRIRKESEAGVVDYLGNFYERRTSETAVDHVYYISNDARTVGQLTLSADGVSSSSALTFVHPDHLGSAELLTQANGIVVERRSSQPFGEPRNPSDWASAGVAHDPSVSLGFTGHERDDEYGLIHMIGRHYDPVVGRFLSPDPIVASAFDTQSTNRYSYVLNNPLAYVDRSGWSPEEPQSSSQEPESTTSIPRCADPSECTEFELHQAWLMRQFAQDMANAWSESQMNFADLYLGFGDLNKTVDPGAVEDCAFASLDSAGNGARLDGSSAAWSFPYGRPAGRIPESQRADPGSKNLVEVNRYGEKPGPKERVHKVTQATLDAFKAMRAQALRDGVSEKLMAISSAYRDEARQAALKAQAVEANAGDEKKAGVYTAMRASEHATGRGIDFNLGAPITKEAALSGAFNGLPAYEWMKSNARCFGFNPYPVEPWHWSYNVTE